MKDAASVKTATTIDLSLDGIITVRDPSNGSILKFEIRTQKPGQWNAGSRVVTVCTNKMEAFKFGEAFAFVTGSNRVVVWRKKRGSAEEPSKYERYADLLNRSMYWQQQGHVLNQHQ